MFIFVIIKGTIQHFSLKIQIKKCFADHKINIGIGLQIISLNTKVPLDFTSYHVRRIKCRALFLFDIFHKNKEMKISEF